MSKPEDSGLERDYCAGLLSLRKLADMYGISEGAIRKRATKFGWVRSAKTGTQSGTQVRKKGAQKGEVRTDKKSTKERKKTEPEKEKIISAQDVEESENLNEFGLSERQATFAEYVAQGKTRVESYRLAGYQGEGNTAYTNASRMLRNAKVSRYVRHLRDKLQQRHAATIDDLIHQLTAIVNADPNELAQYRRVNCRFCWGENHFYQWRDINEFDKAAAKAAADGKAEPEYGGLGFVDNGDPNPDCPKCQGEGRGQVYIPDTRDLDGNARWLYAGVKESKFGIEVLTQNQESARRELARLIAIRLGAAPGKKSATDYTPDDYQKAAQWLKDELGDLD